MDDSEPTTPGETPPPRALSNSMPEPSASSTMGLADHGRTAEPATGTATVRQQKEPMDPSLPLRVR